LNVPTIQGPATPKGFAGWIGLQSYSVGVSTIAIPGGKAGKPVASLLQLTKAVDATSPLFASAYFSGKAFSGATKLYVVSTNSSTPVTEVQIELHNVTVVSDSAASGDDAPTEQLTLSFDAIQYCTPQAKGQPVCSAWNFKTSAPVFPSDKK
jgi:type VI protein secretion system component Hcp